MSQPHDIDGVLIQWGDRLFYPGNRIVRSRPPPRLSALAARQRAAALRERIEATVVRRVPQVMVKLTGGGRGMQAIAAHLRYISKNGRLEIEDERGETTRGKEALRDLADDWRYGGSLIEDDHRPARGVQHHAVDAARHRPAERAMGGAPVCEDRTGRPQAGDGAARPPSQSARAHQRARRVQARQAPQSSQGRPAPLARDVCSAAPGARHRRRGDAASDARQQPKLRPAVANQGARGWAAANDPSSREGRSAFERNARRSS